jgi:hypothetical protein
VRMSINQLIGVKVKKASGMRGFALVPMRVL